jgi:hypothetical protein
MLAALVAVALAPGCGRRAHTRADYGVANRAFFDRQAQQAARGTTQGLDSEEASAIHQHYRESIGRRGAQQQRNDPRSSVLILEDDRNEPQKRK